MTDLHKRVSRRTLGNHRGRRIVVSIEPGDIIGFRHERTQRTYHTTIAACMDMAIRQQVLADKAAKRKTRGAGLAKRLQRIEQLRWIVDNG